MSSVTDEAVAAERRYEMLAATVVVVVVVVLVLGGRLRREMAPRPDEQRCQQLLARYLEQASRQRHPEVDTRAIKRSIAAAHQRASGSQDVRACQQRLSAEQVDCGLHAPNIDEMERCFQ